MNKDPYTTTEVGTPLCYGEEYEEGHDICSDCPAEDGCKYTFDKKYNSYSSRYNDDLVPIRVPSHSYQSKPASPSLSSLFNVTNPTTSRTSITTPSYTPPSTYNQPTPTYHYQTNIPASVPAPQTKTYAPVDYIDTGNAKLMENPVFPNQFEGENAAARLIKNSLLAGARMMLYEVYRGLESALARYLWPPTVEPNS